MKLAWLLPLLLGSSVASVTSTARADSFALGGAIVAPEEVISHGWVVVQDGRISKVTREKPEDHNIRLIETRGVIYPGFIDLHNHPMYSVFEHWTAGRTFINRYEWRDLQEYKDRIGAPGSELQKKDDHDQTFCDLDEYAEAMAVIGGTTSVTGISARRAPLTPIPGCIAGMVRNLDWASGFYGTGVGHERVQNALGVTPRDMKLTDAAADVSALSNGALDLLLAHVAEGSRKDMETGLEFLALQGRGLLRPHVAVIHGIGLGEDDFTAMRAADVALIWSPRSNIELYGETTDIIAALKQKVPVALAPDWSPTGSVNVLAEIKYASQLSQTQLSGALTDRQLFEMSTAIPARIAGIDDKVGRIAAPLFADLVVVNSDASQPFETLAHTDATDVRLVLVAGAPIYGTHELMARFHIPLEDVNVCGSVRSFNSAQLPGGAFANVQNRLTADLAAYKLKLAPLVDCGQQVGGRQKPH
jgi:5-methylthioadenosine/S-adenosylhomocysteine deaminase